MDNIQEKIEIPSIGYQGDDKKLKERIFKFKVGSLRIAIFTVVGFVMGAFSHTYVRDSFLPTKVLLAVPYKLSEAIYVSILGTDAADAHHWMWPAMTEFFPHSQLATYVAEVVTVILIAGAIYGSLAYFTGDKRVFTLQRYLKFAGCWCAVILLSIGAAYGINAKAVSDSEKLVGITGIHLTFETDQGLYGGMRVKNELKEPLLKLLYDELAQIEVRRRPEEEIPIHFDFGWGGETECWINCRDCYLVTEQGKTYWVSETFADLVNRFYQTKELPEEINVMEGGLGAASTEDRIETIWEEMAE